MRRYHQVEFLHLLSNIFFEISSIIIHISVKVSGALASAGLLGYLSFTLSVSIRSNPTISCCALR